MAKKKLTFNELMKVAEQYGVGDNVIFTSAAERYVKQVETIQKMQDQLDADGIMIVHTNVKGGENADVNPLVPQIPKHIDTANKTLSVMLDIIQRLGKEKTVERFSDMNDDE